MSGKRAYINAHLLSPIARLNGTGGVLIDNGYIINSGGDVTHGKLPADCEVIDCKGRHLIPGLIDALVFTGEPGTEYRETLASASDAATAGGVTTIVVMPNTDPIIDDAAIVDYVTRRARDTAKARIVPMAAITKGLKGELMNEFGLLKEAGAIAITDATKAVGNAGLFRRVLMYAKDFDMLVVQHVEEPSLATGVMHSIESATLLGLPGIPAAAEVIMLERDLRLVELTAARYHAAQISSAAGVEVIRAAKAKDLPITAGVSINHLILNANDIGAYRTFFKLSPPLRSEEDRRALIAAVADGTIDIIVSAHNPQSPDTKRLPFAEAAFGAVGLDTMLSVALSLHHNNHITLQRLIEAMCEAPARILGLGGGRLSPGAPADFTIVDLNMNWRVEESSLRSRSKNSPFEHQTLEGRAVETVVAGRTVFAYHPPR